MWLKLCLLLMYIIVLFVLARLVEALTWYETGSLSRRLLDPMTLSVAKLKALLEQRGVSYDTVVEKAELTQLVEGTGQVHEDEVDMLQQSAGEDAPVTPNTNFTSGAHFYEQVEDAKDSVWLVQVIADGRYNSHTHPRLLPLSEMTWKSLRKKITKFGVHTGVLDCQLDPWWCERRGWHSSHLLLALPRVYEQKANVATYTYQGPLRQNAVSHWIRQKLHEKIETIRDFRTFKDEWLMFKNAWQEPEVRALLFTNQPSVPMFFSALSVKFPGRVRFGLVADNNGSALRWAESVLPDQNLSLPLYVLLTNEGPYVYGKNQGDCLTFNSMETLLKFLHPCLNDVFIFSFVMANLVSVLEFFLAQGGAGRRLRRCLWCVVKYNAAVIMLWLPLIAMFQLPYLDHLPLFGLKASRLLATSPFGEAFRRDTFFFLQYPYVLAASFLSACTVFAVATYKLTGGRYEESTEPWFNFAQMRTLTHLRSNEFFEPMLMSGYELGGLGSRMYLPTMSLQPVVSSHYVTQLPTWKYNGPSSSSPLPRPCSASSGPSGEDGGKEMERDRETGTSAASEGACSSSISSSCHSAINRGPCCSTHQSHHPCASDLLDGNYHCECVHRGGAAQTQHGSPSELQNPSESNPASSSHAHHSQHWPGPGYINEGRCNGCNCAPSHQPETVKVENESAANDLDGSSSNNVTDSGAPSECGSGGFPEGFLACSQCVICLDEFGCGAVLCGLPCGHVFHHPCILTWLQREHHFCPVCRWPSFTPKTLPSSSTTSFSSASHFHSD